MGKKKNNQILGCEDVWDLLDSFLHQESASLKNIFILIGWISWNSLRSDIGMQQSTRV